MKAYDFEYDGILLSDKGFIICEFESSGLKTTSNGSQITFNTVSTLRGKKYELTSTEYEECIETTFQICKNPCDGADMEISIDELRSISKWLSRKKYLPFRFIGYMEDVYFNSSFNLQKITFGGSIIGIELIMYTNMPFGYKKEVTLSINNSSQNGTATITDESDEEGFIYPYTQITLNSAGNLTICNELENRSTYIANCSSGETITMDYPIISSSIESHKIQDDFNWNFFRIANTFENSVNNLTISLPCTIKITYSPSVKIGI